MADFPIFSKPLSSASSFVKKSGRPLYTQEQLLVGDHLMRLWRHIAYERGITLDYFLFRHKEYLRDTLGKSPAQVDWGGNNVKKPLYADKLTWATFKEFMTTIGLPLRRISVEIIEDGEIKTIAGPL